MIKLSEAEKKEIIDLAFRDELQKLGAWSALLRIIPQGLKMFGKQVGKKGLTTAVKGTNLGKWGKGGVAAIKKGKGLKYFSSFKGPGNQLSKATLKKGKVNLSRSQRVGKAGGTLSRGIRTSVGNMAQNIRTLGKGVKGQGLLKGTKQFGKNLYTTGKRQLRASQYKEVNLAKGQSVVKGKGLFGKSRFFDRKVVATTNRGTGLVKKRAIVRPLSASVTAPGMAAVGFATGGPETKMDTKNVIRPDGSVGQQKRKKSLGKRVASGVKEGLPWLVGAPVGTASLLLGGKKSKKDKDENLVY